MRPVWLLALAAALLTGPVRGANPPDIRFEVALPAGRSVWIQGERIPLTVRLSSSTPNRWAADSRMQDRIGRVNYSDEFRVEPADGVSDPLEGLPGGGGGLGGISGGPAVLRDEPFEYVREVNEWVAFQQPGSYRLTVVTRRVYRLAEDFDPAVPWRAHRTGEPLELVSNTINLEIVEAPHGWAASQMREAAELLSHNDDREGGHEDLHKGGRILRFLRTQEAAFEMVRRMGSGPEMPNYQFRFGVLSSPFRAAVLPFMEQRLAAPDQPVDDLYLETLTLLAMLVREEPLPPYPEAEGPERERWLAQNKEREERRETISAEYHDRLAAALPTKNAAARSVSAATLSAFASSQPTAPAWSQGTATQLRQGFRNLPRNEMRSLLSDRWHEVSGPEMIPILVDLYENPPDFNNREMPNLAVRRLNELDRVRARRIIVPEILEPQILEVETSVLLEDKTLPEAFELFATHLRDGLHAPDQMILRYGDSSLAELAVEALDRRAKARGVANQPVCPSPLHLFVLREAPEAGLAAFRRDFTRSAAEMPQCLNLEHIVMGSFAWSPAFEQVLGDLPGGAPVIAKESAAKLLGRYGSADAEGHLWKAMEIFHEWWDGRQEDLAGVQGHEGVRLELALRNALARGSGWVLDAQGMTRLRNLCISDSCRSDVDNWIRESTEPVGIGLSSAGAENYSVQVGRFHLRSHEELTAKFAQFPAGTRFVWGYRPSPDSRPDLIEEARRIEGIVPGLR